MTIVWPSCTVTVVSAVRLLMMMALTPGETVTLESLTLEISGSTTSLTNPSGLMRGVTFRMMPIGWYWIVL